jgi:class 3 adenylate cyclase
MSIDFDRWLKANGLSALVETFQEHDIGFDLLPELTEDDWRELGLTIGQRRRLKCALEADLRALSVDHLGERRQLTIMFCDLVGSTALATGLDPEDMRIVIRAYQDCCAETIQLYDGAVARFMGDGVMAYFGYPCAHEQNVERAVRAALAITSTVRQLKPLPGLELTCRVGIATGVVVVGELIGEGVAVERAVVGETPNLAARIQNFAPANSVVVSDSTRWLAGGLFAYENLGARDLRGFDAPVQIWRVSGETESKGRFEATRASGKLSRFVGRQIELELLQDAWTQCRDESKGQVLVIRGDAGIGKSRIIHVLRRRLAADEHEFLGLQCSPFHVNSAWYPIVDLVRRLSTAADGASPLARTSALREHWPVDREELLLFTGLLQFDMDDTSPGRERSYPPELHRERLLKAFEKVLLTLAERRPVLMHLEDAHWMDPSTSELLARVSRLVADIRVLLVVTCRNEIEITLPEDSPTTVVELGRLSASDGRKLVEQVAGDSRLSAEVLDEIVEKTDGIPLFVEEGSNREHRPASRAQRYLARFTTPCSAVSIVWEPQSTSRRWGQPSGASSPESCCWRSLRSAATRSTTPSTTCSRRTSSTNAADRRPASSCSTTRSPRTSPTVACLCSGAVRSMSGSSTPSSTARTWPPTSSSRRSPSTRFAPSSGSGQRTTREPPDRRRSPARPTGKPLRGWSRP